jgi:hypothetical protein
MNTCLKCRKERGNETYKLLSLINTFANLPDIITVECQGIFVSSTLLKGECVLPEGKCEWIAEPGPLMKQTPDS